MVDLFLVSALVASGVGIGWSARGFADGSRQRAQAKQSEQTSAAVAELHDIERIMSEDQIRAAAMWLISQGWPMVPPPPAWAWKRAYTLILSGQGMGQVRQ